jgi:hypothetical protein
VPMGLDGERAPPRGALRRVKRSGKAGGAEAGLRF